MTFRHPLRNQWEQVEPQFRFAATKFGSEGVIARAMLEMMPAFCTILEKERDMKTSPDDKFAMVSALSGVLIENVIEHSPTIKTPRAALHEMLARIEHVVRPRIEGAKPPNGLILPPHMMGR